MKVESGEQNYTQPLKKVVVVGGNVSSQETLVCQKPLGHV